MHKLITIKDAFIIPLWLVIAFLWATWVRNKNISEKPCYKYFRIGLFVKIFAGLAFAGIYLFYYGGGDTVYYFWGSESIVKMIGKSFPTFFKLMSGDHTIEIYSMFDRTTGWPTYWRDVNSFSVCRFNVPFYVMGLGSYLGNTIVMNLLLYLGIWRFFKMLVAMYPENTKWMAIAVFFIPSVVFWSSGILKDGWTLTGILVIYTNFYYLFVKRKKIGFNILLLILWSYIVFSIRPFLLYATLGSVFIWVGFASLKTIKSKFLRTLALPIIIAVFWIIGTALLTQLGQYAGNRYTDVDAMLETAKIIQDDLKKEYYGGNTFDIGSFEPTLPGVLSKAPQAIMAGLFRPYLWEARSPLMLVSGIENLFLLLTFFIVLIITRIIGFFKSLKKHPFLLSVFTLAISMAFMMGLTVANFGSLVRYVIPVTMLFMVVLVVFFNKLLTKPET